MPADNAMALCKNHNHEHTSFSCTFCSSKSPSKIINEIKRPRQFIITFTTPVFYFRIEKNCVRFSDFSIIDVWLGKKSNVLGSVLKFSPEFDIDRRGSW